MTGSDLLPQGWTWERVLIRLEEHTDLEAGAREHGALRRVRIVKTAGQLLRLVLVYVLSGLSLRGTAAWAEASGQASFSDVALLKRLRNCGPWLSHLASELALLAHAEGSVEESSRRIVAVDATAICSPGDKKDYRLLHTVYDVTAQRFITTQMTDRSIAERLNVGTVKPGEIRLGDRLYARFHDLHAVQTEGADFVVRLGSNALRLKTLDGAAFDRVALCRKAEAEGIQEQDVTVRAIKGAECFQARLVILPLSPQAAEKARALARKNAKKWGYKAGDAGIATAGCLMLITSLPAKDWPATKILELYRRRWQVELAFKRLKSIIGLESLKADDPGLVSAWIHAVLVIALLIDLERPPQISGEPDSLPLDNREDCPFRSGVLSHLSHAA